MRVVHIIAQVLIIIGGLNWGLVGAFDFNLVGELFGADSALTNTIYVLVGLAAIYELIMLFVPPRATEAAPAKPRR